MYIDCHAYNMIGSRIPRSTATLEKAKQQTNNSGTVHVRIVSPGRDVCFMFTFYNHNYYADLYITF